MQEHKGETANYVLSGSNVQEKLASRFYCNWSIIEGNYDSRRPRLFARFGFIRREEGNGL